MSKEVKKDRHSNTGMRGAPKKGGAGGKGTWGVGGKDDLRVASNDDPNDPNYDSEDDHVVEGEIVLSKMDLSKPSEVIIKEYISGGDLEQTVKALQELKLVNSDLFVKDCLLFGIEHHAYERELISQLLSALYGQAFSAEKIEDGFQRTLLRIDDISLDNPDAVDVLSKFLARAVVDEIVAPAFLTKPHDRYHHHDNTTSTSSSSTSSSSTTSSTPSPAAAEGVATDDLSPKAKEVLSLANGMITERHRIDRLAHVWGPGDLRSVRRLREETATLLAEYLDTGDLSEADKCVRSRIDAPSFYFQIVKQAVRLAFTNTPTTTTTTTNNNSSSTSNMDKIIKLLAFFSKEGLFSTGVVEKGLSQIYEKLDDETLDNPNAPTVLAKIVDTGKQQAWITPDYQPPPPSSTNTSTTTTTNTTTNTSTTATTTTTNA